MTITWGRSVHSRESFPLGLGTILPCLLELSIRCQSIPFRPEDVDELTTSFLAESHFPTLQLFRLSADATLRTKSWWGSREYFALRVFLLKHSSTLATLDLPFWAPPERILDYAAGITVPAQTSALTALQTIEGPLETVRRLAPMAPYLRRIVLNNITDARGFPRDSSFQWPQARHLRALRICASSDDEIDISQLHIYYPDMQELEIDVSGICSVSIIATRPRKSNDQSCQAVYRNQTPTAHDVPPSPVVPLSPGFGAFPGTPRSPIFEFPPPTPNWLSRMWPTSAPRPPLQARITDDFLSSFALLSWVSIRLPRSLGVSGKVQRFFAHRSAFGEVIEVRSYDVDDTPFVWQ
jgi:hypothetical protein